MNKEQTRELLNDYINFHVENKNIDKPTLDKMIESAKTYVEGVK